jgi:LacI family transcriptional regulator
MSRATIFDVAKVAGVSIKTVSRVVNNEPNVRDSTRERVEDAIAMLKYRPDQSARNLASHRTHLIGLVYDDPAAYELPSSGYIIRMQHGALKACRSALSELLIHPCDFRKKKVGVELKSLIEETRPAGIIVAAPLSNMPKIVRAIEATGTPFVRISPGKTNGKQLSVSTNDREVCAEMTRYLAGLGHKRIAFITGDPNHAAVANRFLGYQDGLDESGLEYSANDDMAAGVLRTANRLGIDVPGQLSVTGFDDITLARQVDPALTTIRQPLARMAERAAEMLINSNGGSEVAKGTEVVPATIKIRESTGPAPD